MNVSLTPELEKFVAREVKSGMYQTASEVIRAALRRLRSEKESVQPWTPRTREELEKDLLASVDRYERGEYVDGKIARRRLMKKLKQERTRG